MAEIVQPVSGEEENPEEHKAAGLWWISVLAVFAAIVTVIVVTKVHPYDADEVIRMRSSLVRKCLHSTSDHSGY